MVLTEKGFKRPTFDELLERQIQRARKLLGEDIDTSGQSVLGKYLRINVYDLAECYELLEDIYYARFPNSARGQSLDRLCAFAGTVRNPATAAQIKVRFTGTAGAVVPMAFLIAGGGQTYYVDRDYTIGGDGSAEAYAVCTEPGTAGNISQSSDLNIVNPAPDLAAVEMTEIVSYGQDRESDTALRIRFNQSVAGAGSATVDAISGAVSRVALVDGVAVVENDTEAEVDGRPPHSFECYVLAPESQDQLIAEAIFSKKPLGIKTCGQVAVEVRDKGGKAHTVRFSRTAQKNIRIRMVIRTNQYYETDGGEQIRDNLQEYINNLANGESVYLSGLYGYIHSVHGVVTVQRLELAEAEGEWSTADISVGEYEIARIRQEDIEIEVAV